MLMTLAAVGCCVRYNRPFLERRDCRYCALSSRRTEK
jgi:hypothetical protein